MKLIDIIPDNWEEYSIEHELDLPHSKERFMEYFELNGEMMMVRLFEEYTGTDGSIIIRADFHCGPSIGGGGISDSIYTDDYLEKICNELNIKCDVGAWENGHCFIGMKSLEDGRIEYDRIRDRISQDFKVNDEGDLL